MNGEILGDFEYSKRVFSADTLLAISIFKFKNQFSVSLTMLQFHRIPIHLPCFNTKRIPSHLPCFNTKGYQATYHASIPKDTNPLTMLQYHRIPSHLPCFDTKGYQATYHSSTAKLPKFNSSQVSNTHTFFTFSIFLFQLMIIKGQLH